MSERSEHLADLRRGVVLFTAAEPFDLDVAGEYFPFTLIVGSEIPVYEVEMQDCENGCCTKALLHDTANGTLYAIGETEGPDGPEPPPPLVRLGLRRLQGVLN